MSNFRPSSKAFSDQILFFEQSEAQQQQHESPCQQSQLQQLLKTNKILIQNKKNIYTMKIVTYDKQLQKIGNILAESKSSYEQRQIRSRVRLTMKDSRHNRKKPINQQIKNQSSNSDRGQSESDSEPQESEEQTLQYQQEQIQALTNKLAQIQSKRNEAIEKLRTIQSIELDVASMKQRNRQKDQQNKQRTKAIQNKENTVGRQPASNRNENPKPVKQFARTQKISQLIRQQKQKQVTKQVSSFISLQQNAEKTKYRDQNIAEKQTNLQRQHTIYQDINSSQSRSKKSGNKSHSRSKSKSYGGNRNKHKNKQSRQQYMLIEQQQGKYMKQQINLWTEGDAEENQQSKNISYLPKPKKIQNKQRKLSKAQELQTNLNKIQQDLKKLPNLSNLSAKNPAERLNKIIQQSGNEQKKIKLQIKCIIQTILGCKTPFLDANWLSRLNLSCPTDQPLPELLMLALPKIHTYITTVHHMSSELFQKYNISTTRTKDLQKQIIQKQRKWQQNQQQQITQKQQNLKIKQSTSCLQQKFQQINQKFIDKQNSLQKIISRIKEVEMGKTVIEREMTQIVANWEKKLNKIQVQLRDACNCVLSIVKIQKQQKWDKPQKSESACSNLQYLTSLLTAQCQCLKSHLPTVVSTIQAFSTSVTSLSQKQSALQSQTHALTHTNTILNQSNSTLQLKAMEMEAKIKQLQHFITKIRQEKDNLDKNINQLKKQIQEYENLSAIRKMAYSQLDTKYNTLKGKKQKLQGKVEKMGKQLAEADNKVARLNNLGKMKQGHLQEISQQISSKMVEKQQIIKQIQLLDTDLISKKQILQTLEAVTAQNKLKLQSVELSLIQNQSALNVKSCQLQSLMNEVQGLQVQIPILNGEITSKNALIVELSNKIAILQNQLCNTSEKLQKISNNLCSQIEGKQKTIQSLTQTLQNLNKQVENQYSNLKTVQQQYANMVALKECLQPTISELLLKKQQAIQYIGVKYGQLQDMEALKNQLIQQVTQIEANKKALQTETQQIFTQKQNLQQQISELEIKKQNMDTTIDQMRDEQTNLLQRVREISSTYTKIIVELAVIAYTDPASTQPQIAQPDFQLSLQSLLPTSTKQKIQQTLSLLLQSKQTKQKFEKLKQANRKLKFQCERLKKLEKMQLEIQHDISKHSQDLNQ